MIGKQTRGAMIAAVALGVTMPAMAQDDDVAALRAELAALRAEVAEVRGEADQTWMNERRAEEVKTLIAEVLNDADTRASLGQGGLTAGHDGKFFLASADNAYRLNIGGQIQFRYIANFRNDADDEVTEGFQHRRTKLSFSGHVGDPRLGFKIMPVVSRNGGNIAIEEAVINYQLTDDTAIIAGTMKIPFLRETLQSSSRQLAVERSLVEAHFGAGYSSGVQLTHRMDPVRLAFMVSDGAGEDFVGFQNTSTHLGLSGRADVKLAGEWGQLSNFGAWGDEGFAAFLGVAAHFDEGMDDAIVDDQLRWTVDATVKMNHIGLYGAVAGLHDTKVAEGAEKFEDLGFLVQGSYMFDDRFEPFARYEMLMPDSSRDAEDVSLLTLGANYYFKGHAAKLTSDIVWVMDPLDGTFVGGSNGLGLLTDEAGADDQFVWRTQFQLLF
ncbi:MAG: porin [Phycisphaeraceae bacterium]